MAEIKIILASGSPRRHELLLQAGIAHEVRPVDVDETLPLGITPDGAVEFLSKKKAAAGAELFLADGGVVIAADTLVASGNEIFGKPQGREDAHRMLRAMSGTHHRVLTGVTVTDGERSLSAVEETLVFMRELSDDEIFRYIDNYPPFDKAGAYGIQDAAARFVCRIEGDFSNVVGLPICRTALMLDEIFSAEKMRSAQS